MGSIIIVLAVIMLAIIAFRYYKKKTPPFEVVVQPLPAIIPGYSYWRAAEYECSEGYCSTFKGLKIVAISNSLNPTLRKAAFDRNNPISIFLLEEQVENPFEDYIIVTDLTANCKEACQRVGEL